MPLSLGEMINMYMRRVPVRLMQRCLRRLEAEGLSPPADQMEAHLIAGGNLERVVEALLLAHREGIPADWLRLSALDLGGYDPVAVVRGALTEHELVFERYSPADPEPIVGYTRDRTAVRCACRVLYRPPLSPDPAPLLERLQERLAVCFATGINTAESLPALDARKTETEARLLSLACGILPSVRSVQVTYAQVDGPPTAA